MSFELLFDAVRATATLKVKEAGLDADKKKGKKK
jgi:hypothetical protein